MLRNLVILTTAFFMSTAFAADKKEKKAIAKGGATETLNIDPASSSVYWVGSKKLGDKHNGQIKLKDGQVELKEGKLTGGTFTMDMTTISNDDLKDKPDYQNKLVGHLKSDDFFKVEKHPTSEFKITSVKEKDGKPWVIGKLTMLGKTDTIEFPATVENKDGVVTGKAKVEIDRTKWGLTYGAGNIFKELTADKVINNKFELDLTLVAKTEPATAAPAAKK